MAPSDVDRVHASRPYIVATDVTQLSWKLEYCSILGGGGGEVDFLVPHNLATGVEIPRNGRICITYEASKQW